MRKLYPVFVFVIVLLSCRAVGLWKRIPLTQSGVISLPATWHAFETDSAVTENAYGPGVSCRTLLNAESPNAATTILMYWPCNEDITGKFVSDMADALMGRYNSRSRPRHSETKIGLIRASSITYAIGGHNSQKVTAFTKDGKIYSIITSYKSDDEYEVLKDLRGIITHWKF